MKTLLIDDETPARKLVEAYLTNHPTVEVIGEATNGFEGLKMINELKPDLIFLDVQMPKLTGFELLELLDTHVPEIIFCTAYDEYALKAFEHNAVDYLLKPFTQKRLLKAVNKVTTTAKVAEKRMVKEMSLPESLERIVVKDRSEITIIDIQDIDFLEAQVDYVEIHTKAGKFLKKQTMNHYESVLPTNQFVRIHRKFILNINQLAKIDKYGKETYSVILKNGQQLTASASGYAKLKEVLGM
jgi:two-component system LytT family response regulator